MEFLLLTLDPVCIGYDFSFYHKMLTRYGKVCGHMHLNLLPSLINDGNRTNRSAINTIIIRVITKSTDRVAGG